MKTDLIVKLNQEVLQGSFASDESDFHAVRCNPIECDTLALILIKFAKESEGKYTWCMQCFDVFRSVRKWAKVMKVYL